jgi:hypothetical protein
MAEGEQEPFPTDDPRRSDIADQYPESNPEGAAPAEAPEQGPESGTGGANAPSTSSPNEGGPGQATGNPDAAGG